MFASGGGGLHFQTDDLVTLVAALVGGGFALLGGWLGAKYQGRQAAEIARRIRQQERDEITRQRLEAMRGELKSTLWEVQHGQLRGPRARIFRSRLEELLVPNDHLHNVRLFRDLNHDLGVKHIEDAIADVEAALARPPDRTE